MRDINRGADAQRRYCITGALSDEAMEALVEEATRLVVGYLTA